MRRLRRAFLLAAVVALLLPFGTVDTASSLPGIITTVAGGGPADGTAALSAGIPRPSDAVRDAAGNLYVSSYWARRIYKVDASGQLSLLAGGCNVPSPETGPAISACLNGPLGLAVDSAQNLFIADTDRVRRIDATTGIITTVQGPVSPQGVAIDTADNLFVAEAFEHRVSRIDAATGLMTTVAGTGTSGFNGDGIPATTAQLNNPVGVAVDAAGNLFIAEYSSGRLRRVDASTGLIGTVATGAPTDVAVDATGNAYFLDQFGSLVRRVDAASLAVSTIAGTGVAGYGGDGGPAVDASLQLSNYTGLFADASGSIWVADGDNFRIRRIDFTTGIIDTVVGTGTPGDGGLATAASLSGWVGGVAVDGSGNLFIADRANRRVRRVAAVTGIVTTVAGGGPSPDGFNCIGPCGDGGPATEARLNYPSGLALDSSGNLFVADSGRVRRVDAQTGVITTVAGSNTNGFSGDGGPATSATFSCCALELAVDSTGNLFITDIHNNRIRRVDSVSGIVTTVAGDGGIGFNGDGIAATSASLYVPAGIAIDPAGNLHIADLGNQRIRRVDAVTGLISTVAGSGLAGPGGDDGPAVAAVLGNPNGVAFDPLGNLFIADGGTVRRVDVASGLIATIAGNGLCCFGGDGGPAINAQLSDAAGLTFNQSGDLFIADRGNNRIRRVTASPFASLSSTTLSFGNQALGTSSSPQTVSLTNTGAVPLNISSVVLSGDFDQTNTCGTLLASGASCTVDVRFAPSAPGTRTGAITISGDAFGGPHVIGLTGIVIATPTVTVTGGTFTYNGVAHPAAVSVTGAGGVPVTGTLSVLYTPGGLSAPVNAGTYAVSATFTSSEPAYTNSSAGGVITIDPAAPTVTVTGGTFTFDGNPHAATAMATAGGWSPVPGSFSLTYAPGGSSAPTEIGTYLATAVFTSDTPNFAAASGTATVVITNQPAAPATPPGYGIITTVAGGGPLEGIAAAAAPLPRPTSVAKDNVSGNVYFASAEEGRVYSVDSAGMLTVIAGKCTNVGADGIPALDACLYGIGTIALDASGNLLVAEVYSSRVRRIDTATGIITTVAGGSGFGFSGDGGPATSATLVRPEAVAVDAAGNLFIVDDSRIRRVDAASGIITTVAGTGVAGFNGNGIPATTAQLDSPFDVAVDAAGNLFIADSWNGVRRVDASTGMIATVSTEFPLGLSVDAAGNLFYSDWFSQSVRRLDASSFVITTIAGNGEFGYNGDGGPALSASLGLSYPHAGLAVDAAGNVLIADGGNERIREVVASSGAITTIAGSGTSGDGGPGTAGRLRGPQDVAVDASGNLIIADQYNARIRRVDAVTGAVTSIAGGPSFCYDPCGDGGPATAAGLNSPNSVALDSSGNLFVAGQGAVRRIDAVTGIISTVAGNNNSNFGFSGDGGPATSATFGYWPAVAVDAAGNLFIADSNNHRVRRVDAITGTVETIAGNGLEGFNGDGIPATSASLNMPTAVRVDASGHVYVADSSNFRIRRVDAVTGLISTVAGNGSFGFGTANGDGGPAVSASVVSPSGLAFDSAGNLFISASATVRVVDATTGIISTVAGNGDYGFAGDGGPATAAALNGPKGIAVNQNGDLFIADMFNNRIRRVGFGPAKAASAITWNQPSGITSGTPLGAAQLNASASVAGTFVYTPPIGTVLNAGSAQTLSAAFTPFDTVHYTAASTSVTIDVAPPDTTVPEIAILTPSAEAAYAVDQVVLASYTCTDASGVASCAGPVAVGEPIDTSTVGTHTFAVSAGDTAGNASSASVTYVVLDGPTITVTSPIAPIYERGSTVFAQYSCSDALTCVGEVANGAALDTSAAGPRSFTITATDAAGNVATQVVTYMVSLGACVAPLPGATAWLSGDGVAEESITRTQATWTGMPAYAAGKVAQAFSVGNGSTVSLPFEQAGAFTLQAWVQTANPAQPEFTGILSTGAAGQNATSLQIELDGTGNYRLQAGDGELSALFGPATGDFQHLAVTFDGSAISLYLNGQLVESGAWMGSPGLGFHLLTLGLDRDATRPFAGSIDEVQVFNRALTVAEVQQSFLAGSSGFCKNHPPVAVAAASPNPAEATGATGATVTLDGTASSDPDSSDTLTYTWREGSTTLGSGSTLPAVLALGSHTITLTVADNHSVTSSADVLVNVHDTTAPAIAIASPAENASYSLDQLIVASYSCTDVVGVDSCAGSVPSGDVLDTTMPGTFSFTVTGTDGAGNPSTTSVTYSVLEPPTITVTSPSEPIYERGSAVLAEYVCGNAVTCVGDVASGTPLDTATPGLKSLTVSASDAAGNTTTAVVTFMVSLGTCTMPFDGLTAWLPGDDSAAELIGGTTATWFGAEAYAAGKVAQAFAVASENSVSLPFQQVGPFTLQAWLRTADRLQQAAGILSTGALEQAATSFQVGLDGYGNYQLSAGDGMEPWLIGPATDSFQHLAITFDGVMLSVYLNGQPVQSDVWAGSPGLGFHALNIGIDRDGTRLFTGMVDEVQVFDRALEGPEVLQTFQTGAAGLCKNQPPVAVAVASPSPAEADGPTGATVTLDGTASSDSDGDALTYTWTEGPTTLGTGATLSVLLGIDAQANSSHTITLTVDDGHHHAVSSTVTVVVRDTTPPQITVVPAAPGILVPPAGQTLEATGADGAVASWSATATDVVDLVAAVTCTRDSGSVFALGSTSVTCTATDAHGNSASSTFDVVVRDTTPAVLTLLGDNPMTVEGGTLFADPGATATDSVAGDLTAQIQVTGTVNAQVVGSSTLTYTVSDGVNITTATRTVNVGDTTAPTLTLIGDNPMTVEGGTAFTDPGATATDTVAGTLTAQIEVTGTVDTQAVGSYTLTYVVGDGFNTTTVVRTVNVVDTTAPVLTLLGANPMTVEGGAAFTDPGATATDTVAGVLTAQIQVIGAVNTQVVGSYTLTYTVSDGFNSTTTTRAVNVVDTTAPVLTLLGANPMTVEGATPFTDPGATANDTVAGLLTAQIQVTGTVNTQVVGDYTVTYTVSDSINSTTVTRTVNVVDTTAPVLTLVGANPITVEGGTAFTDPGATATDTVAGTLTAQIQVTGTVNTQVVGGYTLTYTVSDGISSTTTTRTVNVVDTTAPVLTLVGDSPMTVEGGTPFIDPGATATDTVAGILTAQIQVTGAVNTLAVGSYTLTYTVSDGFNTTTVARTVNVADTTAPTLTLLGANPMTVEGGTAFTDPGATATDTVAGILTAQVQVTGTVNAQAVGGYTLTYTVSDGFNTTTLTRTVNIVDTTAPVLTLVGANPMTVEGGTPFTDPGATATDTVAGALTAQIQVTGTVNALVVGGYTLTYTVSDGFNTTTTTRTVNVVDTTAPVLTLLGANPLTVEGGTAFTDPGATATDTVAGILTVQIQVTGTVTAQVVGSYTLTYTVSDGINSTTTTRTVNVVDTTAPVLTLVGANPMTVEGGTAFIDPGATAADTVAGSLTAQIQVTGTVNALVVGGYTLTYTVSDGFNTTTTTRTVNVVDTTAPVLTLLGANPMTVEGAMPFTEPGATATDTVAGTLTAQIQVTGTVNTLVVGSYTLTYTVSDGINSTTTTRTVNVVDTTAPVLTLAGGNPITVEGGTAFTDPGATATDAVSGNLTAQIQVSGSVNSLVIGNYTLTYTVSDGFNTTAATRTVNVVDTTAPVLTLVGANPMTVEGGTAFTEPGATAADTVAGILTAQIQITGTVNTQVVGAYTVTYIVSDGINSTTVTRTVNVVDTTAPVLTLLGANPMSVEGGTPFIEPGATAADTVAGTLTAQIQVTGTVNASVVGSYTLDYTVSDGFNTATATRTVNVVDTTSPVLTLIGANPMTVEGGSAFIDPGATAEDTVAGALTGQIQVTGAVNALVVGSYTLTYTVSDGFNTTTTTRTVNVVDTTAPLLTLLGANPATVEGGTPFIDPGATAADTVAGALTAQIQVTGTVNALVVGSYTLTYTVSDGFNTATTTRTVNVVDTTAPVLTLLGASPMTVEGGTAFTDPGASAVDTVAGSLTAQIQVTGTVNALVVGPYTLTYTVSDGFNTSAVTRTVNVVDTTAPVLTLTGANPIIVEGGTAFVDPGATAVDTVAGSLTAQIQITGTVNSQVVGGYTLTYSVSDGFNTTTTTRTVSVVDTTAPVLTLTGANPMTVEGGTGFTDPGAVATDTVGGILTAQIQVTGTVNALVVGSYTLTYSVSDGFNTTTTTRTVNVVDTTAPVLTLVGANPMSVEGGTGFIDPGATATDTVAGTLTAQIQITGTVNAQVVGSYTLTYTVSDGINSTTTTRTVNVVDTTAPVLTLAGGNPATVEGGTAFADPGATATDTVSGDLTAQIQVTGSVNSLVVGSYTLTYAVSDGFNITTTTRTVNVVDTTAPVLTLAGANPMTVEGGTAFTDPGATAADTVAGTLTAQIQITGTVNTSVLGGYTVTYTVSDGVNTTTTTRTVNVVDTTAPTLTLLGDNPITVEGGTAFIEPGATAADTVAGTLTAQIQVTGTVNTQVIGSYTLTYVVIDGVNSATATRTVNVVDTAAPVLTLTGANPMTVEGGAAYTDPGATATDTVAGTVTAQIQVTGSVNTLVVGSYTLTYTVSDGFNTTTTTRTVNVVDTTAPLLTLTGPNPLTVEGGTAFVDPGATATDTVAGVLTAQIQLTGSVNSLVAGAYTLTYTVSDGINSTTTTRTVNVVDTTAPVLTLLGANPMTVEGGTLFTDPGATATDTVAGTLTAQIQVTGTVNAQVVGSYTLTYIVSDGVNSTTTTRTVIVVDTTAPVLTLTGADPMTVEGGTAFTDPGATATDTVAGNLTAQIQVTGSVNSLVVGSYTLTYTMSDGFNTTTATRTVNVVDTTAAVLTLAGDNPMTVEAATPFVDPGATATDTVAGMLTAQVQVTGAVNTLAVGSYPLTYTVSDGFNTTAVTRTVNVVDTTAPVLTLLGANPMTVEGGTTFTDPGAAATDTAAGELTLQIEGTGTVNTLAVGSYTLTYTVNDGFNTTTLMRTVNVVDTTAPVLTLAGDNPMTVEGATPLVEPGAAATDTVAGNLTAQIQVTGTVNTLVLGSYELTYTVSDGFNTTTVTRAVNVVDTTAPGLTLTGANPMIVEVGALFTDPGATAADTLIGSLTAQIQVTGAVNSLVVGSYGLTYTVSDGVNTTAIVRAVNVVDATAPAVQVTSPLPDAIVAASSVDVVVQATDFVGATALTVNGVAATRIVPGTPQSAGWRATVPVALPVVSGGVLRFDVLSVDAAGNTGAGTLLVDNDGIPAVLDRSRAAGVDLSGSYSNDFNNSITTGTLTRNGWTTKLSTAPTTAGGVRATVSGAGTIARVSACVGAAKELRFDVVGETADFACSPTTGTILVKAVSAVPQIELREQLATGAWQQFILRTGQLMSVGSPATASADNQQTIEVRVLQIDEAGKETVVGEYDLAPGASVDVAALPGEPGHEGGYLQFTVLEGTVPVKVSGVRRMIRRGEAATLPIDREPPTVSCGPPDRRWHKDNLRLGCVAADAGVGLARPDDAQFAVTTIVDPGVETENAVTETRSVCDVAENCVVTGPIGGHKVDRKAPAIAVTAPAAGAAYLVNQAVVAAYQCEDGGAGVAACDGRLPNGQPLPTALVGAAAFDVTASDQVGNTAGATVPYAITYGIELLGVSAGDARGRSPIALRLTDAAGVNRSSPTIVVTPQGVTPAGTVATAASSPTRRAAVSGAFRYDRRLDAYVFTLGPERLSAGTYDLSFSVSGDPVVHKVQFQIQ